MSVINLTSENFENEVLKSEKPVLVDFWAEWCGPCRMMAPVVEELAQTMGEAVKVCKIDIDQNPELAEKYGIMSIEEKIIKMYARGFSNQNIYEEMQELYGVKVSPDMVTAITDKILPEIREWQKRQLDEIISPVELTEEIRNESYI